MENKIEDAVLPFKLQQFVALVMEKKRLTLKDALYYLYDTKLYDKLKDDSAKMWYMSSLTLYDLLEKEKSTTKGKDTKDASVLLFHLFCIEHYIAEHKLSGEEVIALFSQNDVFGFLENGFDVLHTQSKGYIVSEITTYIKNRQNKTKQKNNMKLYHGSIHNIQKPTLVRGRENTDFGKGFYTTTSYEQAKKWALIKCNRTADQEHAKAVVSIYEVDDNLLEKDLLIRRFDGATAEWLDFIVGNRKGLRQEHFDIVMGPVANDKLYATLLLFEQGILTVEATIEQLKTHKLFDLLSFHSMKALEEIRYTSSEIVDSAL